MMLDLFFTYIFASSIVHVYGIGLERSLMASWSCTLFLQRIPLLLAKTFAAAVPVYLASSLIIAPAGLYFMLPLVLILWSVIIDYGLSVLARSEQKPPAGERLFLFATVYLSVSEATSLTAVLAVIAAANISFVFTTVLLYAVRQRIELSPTRRDISGLPLALISLGLISLVLQGADMSWWLGEALR